MMQAAPLTISVLGAPIKDAIAPAKRLPIGAMPINGRRINAHHTTTLILFHDALQNCVSRCYLYNHPESGKKHHGQRNYENFGKGKGDYPHTENNRSICNESSQPQNRLPRREIDGACEGADTRCRWVCGLLMSSKFLFTVIVGPFS